MRTQRECRRRAHGEWVSEKNEGRVPERGDKARRWNEDDLTEYLGLAGL